MESYEKFVISAIFMCEILVLGVSRRARHVSRQCLCVSRLVSVSNANVSVSFSVSTGNVSVS